MLAFFRKVCYYTQALRRASKNPGVAKFGIALEWGSRGLEFESRHSDQKVERAFALSTFFLQSGNASYFDAYFLSNKTITLGKDHFYDSLR